MCELQEYVDASRCGCLALSQELGGYGTYGLGQEPLTGAPGEAAVPE